MRRAAGARVRRAIARGVRRRAGRRGCRIPARARAGGDFDHVEEGASRADLDNLAKAPIDLLCDLQLIEGDHRDVIREVHLRWGGVEGMRID